MRTQVAVLCLLVFVRYSQAQLPPDGQPVPKEDGTQAAKKNKDTNSHQTPTEENHPPRQNQVGNLDEQKKADSYTGEELKINRQLAAFTGQLANYTGRSAWFTAGLIVIGALQLFALIWQAKVLRHHSDLIKTVRRTDGPRCCGLPRIRPGQSNHAYPDAGIEHDHKGSH
jgi:hypothetical protein